MGGTLPEGFWEKRANRRTYMGWLGRQLGFGTPKDWCELRHGDFTDNGGKSLLKYYGSLANAMRDYMPNRDWIARSFSRRR